MKKQILLLFLLLNVLMLRANNEHSAINYKTISEISYTGKLDVYAKERLKLDVYYPEKQTDCPVVVWFHGGGLTSGNKAIPNELKQKGIVVVAVNYRLMPKVTIDKCIDDAAEAVHWVVKNITKYNGSPRKIIVSGHSAGGYLTLMVALNKAYLSKYGIDADSLAGYVPFSGQCITHFAHRDMHGRGNLQPSIDEFAPLYWVRNITPPLVLVTGDREQELFGRYEENAYFWRMMKLCGHQETYLYELDGYNHGEMASPAFHILLTHLHKICGK